MTFLTTFADQINILYFLNVIPGYIRIHATKF